MAPPSPIPDSRPVTESELTEHRLKALEDLGVGSRETERRVDGLSISMTSIEKTVIETQTEMRERDARTHASLTRLHQRLDEGLSAFQAQLNAITTADAREQGREEGAKAASTRTWKVVAATLTIAIAFGALVVGILTLIL